MSISTRAELIKELQAGDPDETLVYTYWGREDFNQWADTEQAISLIDSALDNCIGHVNEYVGSEIEENTSEADNA